MRRVESAAEAAFRRQDRVAVAVAQHCPAGGAEQDGAAERGHAVERHVVRVERRRGHRNPVGGAVRPEVDQVAAAAREHDVAVERQRADRAGAAGRDCARDVGEKRRVDVPAALQAAEHQHVVARRLQRAVDPHHALVLVDVDQAGEGTVGRDVERGPRAGDGEAVDGDGRIQRRRSGRIERDVEIARSDARGAVAVVVVRHETACTRQAVGERRRRQRLGGLRS